jgi:hypothetical protein
MNTLRKHVARAAITLAASAASLCAWADGPDVDSRTGAAWWQWALSIPAAANPLVDTTGQNCMVGQSGRTWFLAGTLTGGTVSRRCSIPQGVRLFFPVVNSFQSDSPGICGQGASFSVAELRGFAAAFIDGITSKSVTLDSRPVRVSKRLRSEVFPLAFPADNVLNALFCASSPVPAAIYPRSVDDGYYAEVDDLSVGPHTLQITAAGPGFDLNVVYQLDVVRRDRH